MPTQSALHPTFRSTSRTALSTARHRSDQQVRGIGVERDVTDPVDHTRCGDLTQFDDDQPRRPHEPAVIYSVTGANTREPADNLDVVRDSSPFGAAYTRRCAAGAAHFLQYPAISGRVRDSGTTGGHRTCLLQTRGPRLPAPSAVVASRSPARVTSAYTGARVEHTGLRGASRRRGETR